MLANTDRRYTFEDYLSLESDDRWELFDGRLFLMGAPSVLHQITLMQLSLRVGPHFASQSCVMMASPLAVKLTEDDAVQPDLMVVCRPEILKKNYVDGPPDLVVEVLSPSTQRTDRVRKLNLYAKCGVKEYWIVTTRPLIFEVLRNRGGIFEVAGTYGENDVLLSPRFPGLTLNLADLQASLPQAEELAEPEPAYY